MKESMMLVWRSVLSVLLLWAATAQGQTLFLGSVAMDVPAAMVRRLTPLTEYLSRKTGLDVQFRASPNLGSAVNDLGGNVTQIAYLTPVAYLEAREKYGVEPLVSPLTHGQSTFTLVIAVRADSPYQKVTDLRGRRFAFGDPKALLQPAVVVGSGIRLEEFAAYDYLKHYDNIAKAVLNRDFDAGILKDTVFEEFEARGLRRLYTSPPLPGYVFAVNSTVPAATVAKLKAAFLELKATDPAHKAILRELDAGYDGFVTVTDRDYEVIRRLIAPFRKP
jgi:phosphonate transport system substrate-binding protein